VLITIDTLRARNLGAYGYERNTSPHIDRLAQQGVLFLDAFAPSSWTLPSLGSLLSSRNPQRHGAGIVRLTGKPTVTAMATDLPVLAEVLGGAGYTSAVFFESAYPLDQIGITRGFDRIEKRPSTRSAEIRSWMEERGQAPFFLWLHYLKPHTPYVPSPESDRLFTEESVDSHRSLTEYWNRKECRKRYEEASPEVERIRLGFYDESIRDSDLRVGETLAALRELGLEENTLVVLTSDHGEEFFEHGGCDHGETLYDEVLHVPLVLRHPAGIASGVRIPGQVRLIDVAPTILALLDLEIPEGFAGRSLTPQLSGEAEDRPVFAGFLANGEPAVALRMDGFKYMHHPRRLRYALYDLKTDPEEQINLIGSGHHPKLREFRELTRAWLTEDDAAPSVPVSIDDETRQRLEALGYSLE
jgi:arylsulfatase A-like enzyme